MALYCYGKGQRHSGAMAFCTGERDAAAVALHHVPGEGQTDPEAPPLRGEERSKDAG